MWKICGLGVLIHQGLPSFLSADICHWSHWFLAVTHFGMWHNLNWMVFLPFNPLFLVRTVPVILHPSHWLVWLMDWFEFTDLPKLQSVNLGYDAFAKVHSVVFESDWMDGVMIQICLNYNQFNLVGVLFKVMVVMIERRLVLNPTTTRTHWQCEVRLNKLMNE